MNIEAPLISGMAFAMLLLDATGLVNTLLGPADILGLAIDFVAIAFPTFACGTNGRSRSAFP
ncbi:MAG: hypothetical protein IPK78_19345 [Rhodospirillales bacterium]|nr:hypothetical protein [Rhodospirillales bacterium]